MRKKSNRIKFIFKNKEIKMCFSGRFFFLLLLLLLLPMADEMAGCNSTTNKELIELNFIKRNYIKYENFQDLSQIYLKCDLIEFRKTNEVNNTKVYFYPNRPIFISQTPFDLMVYDYTAKSKESIVAYVFSHINGFNMVDPHKLFNVGQPTSSIVFRESKFDFYYKSKLVDLDSCDYRLMQNETINIFAGLSSIILSFDINVQYEHLVCPYAFKNAEIFELRIEKLEYVKLINRRLKFMQIKHLNETNSVSLNSKIDTLALKKCYRPRVDRELVNVYVFESLRALTLSSTLDYIEPELLKSFRYLLILKLSLFNLREFLHASTNEWLKNLYFYGDEYETKSSMLNSSEARVESLFRFYLVELHVTDDDYGYGYPDEDFCLFKHFPYKKFVLAILTRIKENFTTYQAIEYYAHYETCTFAHLIQNNKIYEIMFSKNDDWQDYFSQTFLNNCNLTTKLAQACSSFNLLDLRKEFVFNYYDLVYAFQWLEFIEPIVLFPLVSLLALLFNLLSILIIRDKHNQKEYFSNQPIFKYVLLNSIFNCIECFIAPFRLMSVCIESGSVYCSSLKRSLPVQYFRLYVIGYFGEAMKTSSILTCLLFSVVRYLETSASATHNRLNRLKLVDKKLVSAILVFSFLTSISKVFEFQVESNFETNSIESPSQFMININNSNGKLAFKASHFFYFFHYVLNDFVLLVTNFIVDVKLVVVVRNGLKRKEEKKLRLEGGDENKLKQFLKEKNKVENKTSLMVILTFSIYLFCRLPELLSYIFAYLFRFYLEEIVNCYLIQFCYLLANTVEFFYIFSYLVNILVYYKFNKNFKNAFKHFFQQLF